MNIPIIDWQLSIQLAGNNIHHANEFLQCLVNDLLEQLEIIRNHLKQDKKDLLKKDLHRLLGGLSYSGAERLKNATKTLHYNLTNDQDISHAFIEFESEAQSLIEYAKNESTQNVNTSPSCTQDR